MYKRATYPPPSAALGAPPVGYQPHHTGAMGGPPSSYQYQGQYQGRPEYSQYQYNTCFAENWNYRENKQYDEMMYQNNYPQQSGDGYYDISGNRNPLFEVLFFTLDILFVLKHLS